MAFTCSATGNEILHIAFGVDDDYFPPMAAAMISIVDNNPKLRLAFHVVATGIPREEKQRLAAFAQERGLSIQLHEVNNEGFTKFSPPSHLTHAVYNRFLICGLLDKIANKVLYLDADIICVGNIGELLSLDMGDKIVAAVEDIHQKKAKTAIGLSGDDPYFNSGVLYIDVEKWNKHNITDVLFKVLDEAPKCFPLPDQDALNIALAGKVIFMDRKWNVFIDEFPVTQQSVFLHYNGQKPWQLWSEQYQDARFVASLARTPWADWRYVPKTRKHRNRQAKYMLRCGRLMLGIYWYVLFLFSDKCPTPRSR